MNPRLTIPCLHNGDLALRPQPIMQFKELEVDAVRYTAWQCSCALDREMKKRMAARIDTLAREAFGVDPATKTQVDP